MASRRDSFDEKLDRHRREKRDKRDDERKRYKETETPEEKRARRIAKKLQKEERRRAQNEDALPESIPYSDLNNPFNDQNLTQAFVWEKKLETEGKADISAKQAEKLARERIHRNVAEMEELKRNRDARMAAREDMEMIAREQDRSQYSDWRRVEDSFHLKQAKLRSKIRLEEGRGKPIDHLARYIAYGDGQNELGPEEELDLKEPQAHLKGCSLNDYEDLLADIKVYRVVDGKRNDEFWDDIVTLAKSEIKRAENARRRAEDVHSTVQTDILKIFKGKTYDELSQLSAQIGAKIRNAGTGVDVAYWENLLDTLHPFMAKLRLRELHAKKQQIRLDRIREEQGKEMARHEESVAASDGRQHAAEEAARPQSSGSQASTNIQPKTDVRKVKKAMEGLSLKIPFTVDEYLALDDEQREQKWQLLNDQQVDRFTLLLYAQGQYSPRYEDESQAMPGIETLNERDDSESVEKQRQNRKADSGDPTRAYTAEETRLFESAKAAMGKDEEAFGEETQLERQTFLWSDKHRPRKPKYFNKVHTGFDWNKYNQTHYDIDNPPPKIVQGYRFNIFYPDLLDITHTPSFKLIECADKDFAIIRFKAGPPYEDIAFKIVNREWEVIHKHGYKCQFQGGVFQLHFMFKRYRYRR